MGVTDRFETALLLTWAGFGAVVAWAVPGAALPSAALLRVVVVLIVTGLGTAAAWDIGLTVRPHGGRYLVVRAVLIGLVFGVYAAVADGLVFRAHLPAAQAASIATIPAWQRIAGFMPLVVVDEDVYRLGLVSLLAWCLGASKRGATAFRLAIVAVAIVYVLLHLQLATAGGPLTPVLGVREVAVHVSAGCLWGYLFWRHGLTTAIVAHASAHVSLQIGLGALLRG